MELHQNPLQRPATPGPAPDGKRAIQAAGAGHGRPAEVRGPGREAAAPLPDELSRTVVLGYN